MKKITNYIVILAVIGMFLMTAVCALDLETQDFDGHFKMDVPKDASFEKMNDTYETGVLYSDEKNDINILYTDNSDYAGNLPSFTAEAGTKDYSDAEPYQSGISLGTIAIVIVIVVAVAMAGIILWHRNKSYKR